MGGQWVTGGNDDEGRKRPDVYIPSSGGSGGSKKEGSGCAMALPRVIWTIVKVISTRIVTGRKPQYLAG